MQVAIVHDWLLTTRGGEKCLEVFCELFPRADVYTLVYAPERVSGLIKSMNIRASRLNDIPRIERAYRYFLPLFPRVIESFDLRRYDLILSSSHCVAKGIFPHRALHIAYVHAPMRYVWDMHDAYFGKEGSLLSRVGMSLWRRYLQEWDVKASERVDYFLANSRNVAAKIQKLYRRRATVIHPPVDSEKFRICDRHEPYYLVVSALVPYKRIDIAIRAFNKMRLPLKVVGEGPLRRRLEKIAGSNIEFLGWVDDSLLVELYGSCQALIFPGEEDFGIVPLEAQACGRPVIAYEKGGVLETVIPAASNGEGGLPPTGIFFARQGVAELVDAVDRHRKISGRFDPEKIRDHAAQFSRQRFRDQIYQYIRDRLSERSGATKPC
ncbi:MAG TPA: glycosyltransferase [Candidatus Binatia bacterium]|jgi:glycosyltransferase involved in cell wall biosynthesis